MAVKSQAAITAEIMANISDALGKQNTAAKVRQVLIDLNDTLFSLAGGGTAPTKVSITFQQFKDADIPGSFPIATSAGAVINVLKIKHSIVFEGVGLSEATVLVEKQSAGSYINYTGAKECDVSDNVSDINGIDGYKTITDQNLILNHSEPDSFNVLLTLNEGEIEDLTAGSVDVWYTETICI